MRCAELGVLLGDYADGVADERARRIVDRHIQLCTSCRQELLLSFQIAQQLRRMPLLPETVAVRLPRMERQIQGRLLARARTRRRRPLLVLGVVLLLVVEVGLLWLVLYPFFYGG